MKLHLTYHVKIEYTTKTVDKICMEGIKVWNATSEITIKKGSI